MKKLIAACLFAGSLAGSVSAETLSVSAPPLSDVKVYPNPWKITDNPNGSVHFSQLPDNATVEIFTLSGRLVARPSASNHEALWNVRNDSGDSVASGIYLYLIKDNQGNKTTGKLAVIR